MLRVWGNVLIAEERASKCRSLTNSTMLILMTVRAAMEKGLFPTGKKTNTANKKPGSHLTIPG